MATEPKARSRVPGGGVTRPMSGAATGVMVVSGKSKNALHSLVTASLLTQNRRFSMFHNVLLVPSPFGNGGPAATEARSATVMLPSVLRRDAVLRQRIEDR